jgi:uncharacterized protein
VHLDTVLIKVASRCNINCQYCYVYNQGDTNWQNLPKHMSLTTVQAVIEQLGALYAHQRHPFAVVLHGGEPLLLPRAILAHLLHGLNKVLPSSCTRSIQTNGTLIDDQILDLCDATGTTLSVSLDGPADIHDVFRIAHNGAGTYQQAAAGIARIRQHRRAQHLFTGTLCVVDPRSDPKRIYQFFRELAVPSVDFLFKDGNHTKLPHGKDSVNSTEYGSWLAGVWDCYIVDPAPPRIRILDDFGRLLLGGTSTKEGCGQELYGIVVIDTDGSITKNDTLKSAFDGADRFEQTWSIGRDRLADIANSPDFATYAQLQHPTSASCRQCPFLRVCGGGMPLSRWHAETGLDNPSVYCSDYKLLIQHIDKTLQVLR